MPLGVGRIAVAGCAVLAATTLCVLANGASPAPALAAPAVDHVVGPPSSGALPVSLRASRETATRASRDLARPALGQDGLVGPAAPSLTSLVPAATVFGLRLAPPRATTDVSSEPAPVQPAHPPTPVAAPAPAAKPAPAPPAWVRPNAGPLTSPFGRRWGHVHEGIDLGGGYGSPILAATNGVVLYAGPESGYGRVVKIADSDGTQTWYGHMSRFLVKAGDHVKAGQEIALVGAAGDATGPHLHFEVRIGGQPVDPIPFLAQHGVHI